MAVVSRSTRPMLPIAERAVRFAEVRGKGKPGHEPALLIGYLEGAHSVLLTVFRISMKKPEFKPLLDELERLEMERT